MARNAINYGITDELTLECAVVYKDDNRSRVTRIEGGRERVGLGGKREWTCQAPKQLNL